MHQNRTKNVWLGSFLSLPCCVSCCYNVRDVRRIRLLLGFIEERMERPAMDSTLQNIIEIALQQGIWAGLYIYLFFRMLRQNEEREAQYQATFDKLSDNIQSGIENIQNRLDDLEEKMSDKFEKNAK